MGYKVLMWIDDYTIAPRVKTDFGALVWYQSHRMDVPLPSPAYDLYHHDPIQEAADAELSPEELGERIRAASTFSELSDADIRELSAATVPERFRRGETMIPAGMTSRDIFILWSGRARIVVPEMPDTSIELSDGDVYGAGRSRGDSRPRVVVAATDCEILRIDASTAGAVASRNPALAEEIDQQLSSRNRRLNPLGDQFQFEAPDIGAGPGEAGAVDADQAETDDGGSVS
jgi:hypothetical protein